MAIMSGTNRLNTPKIFSSVLFEKMKGVNAGVADLLLYEFRYALEPLLPEDGWDSVWLDDESTIERQIRSRTFYESIQLKPGESGRIVLDTRISRLTCMLFVGLVEGKYAEEWIDAHFYFDIRGFYFLPRTIYFTAEALAHLGKKPFKSFAQRQERFKRFQGIGYKDFMEANAEIDQALIDSMKKLIAVRGTPMLITLAGPTAAGKTEITERLLNEFEKMGKKVATIEVDNFLLDRDSREDKVMGKESIHFEIFKSSLEGILQGEKVVIPRYDFIKAVSSHDPDGSLRPGCVPLVIEPADIIFMEGNFPFHIEEITSLIGVKIVYLTDDPIRLKRKWKRDIDYRKKYDPAYFRNRFFKTQFLRADDIYRPLIQVCDMVVDTTHASLWVVPEIANILE
jgi:uridine kinase